MNRSSASTTPAENSPRMAMAWERGLGDFATRECNLPAQQGERRILPTEATGQSNILLGPAPPRSHRRSANKYGRRGVILRRGKSSNGGF
jgi:hypothetical protein